EQRSEHAYHRGEPCNHGAGANPLARGRTRTPPLWSEAQFDARRQTASPPGSNGMPSRCHLPRRIRIVLQHDRERYRAPEPELQSAPAPAATAGLAGLCGSIGQPLLCHSLLERSGAMVLEQDRGKRCMSRITGIRLVRLHLEHAASEPEILKRSPRHGSSYFLRL